MALKMVSVTKTKEQVYAENRLKNSPLKTSKKYSKESHASSTSKSDKKRT